jgi:hypothetical protein
MLSFFYLSSFQLHFISFQMAPLKTLACFMPNCDGGVILEKEFDAHLRNSHPEIFDTDTPLVIWQFLFLF